MVSEFNDICPILEDPAESVVSGKYGMAPLPGPTNNGGKLLGIPIGAKNPEGAAKLLQWIVGPVGQMEMCRVSGTLTSRKSIMDKRGFQRRPKFASVQSKIERSLGFLQAHCSHSI